MYNLNNGLLCQQYGVSLIKMSPNGFISLHLFSQNQLLCFVVDLYTCYSVTKQYQADNKNSTGHIQLHYSEYSLIRRNSFSKNMAD